MTASPDNFEIIRKSILTGYLLRPRPTKIVEVSALVRCPDHSEIMVGATLSGDRISPAAIDAEILTVAQQMYRSGGSSS